jgi:hypothetical protein
MSICSTGLGKKSAITPKYGKVSTWCLISGWGRSKSYQALADGVLRAKKFGKTTLIDIDHGLNVIEALPDAKINVGRAKRATAG